MFPLILEFLQAILVPAIGVLGVWMRMTMNKVNRIDDQVTNSHSTNLREEGDVRHAEIMAELTAQTDRVSSLERRVDTISTTIKTMGK